MKKQTNETITYEAELTESEYQWFLHKVSELLGIDAPKLQECPDVNLDVYDGRCHNEAIELRLTQMNTTVESTD